MLTPALKKITLVTILPGDPGTIIKCHLRSAIFDCNIWGCYEALSYESGNTSYRMPIIIDGDETTVGLNLWTALKHLRDRVQRISKHELWIDALCLDSLYTFERTMQVESMHNIYHKAKKVHVWLGRDAYDPQTIEKAFQLLEHIATYKEGPCDDQRPYVCKKTSRYKYVCQRRRGGCEYCTLSKSIMGLPKKAGLVALKQPGIVGACLSLRALLFADPHNEIWLSIRALMEHSYWRRRWIIQEYTLAVAVEIHHGSSSMDGELFNLAVLKFIFCIFPEGMQDSHMVHSIRIARESPAGPIILAACNRSKGKKVTPHSLGPLWNLLRSFRQTECSLHHDRVYALLGLADDVGGSLLVDYGQELSDLKRQLIAHYRFDKKIGLIQPILEDVFKDCIVTDRSDDSDEAIPLVTINRSVDLSQVSKNKDTSDE